MKKSRYIITALLLLLVIGAGVFLLSGEDADDTDLANSPTTSEDQPLQEDEVIVYEFEAESAEECTSVETFDEENYVCFFECETEAECDELLAQAESELDQYLDEYEAGSTDKQENVPQNDEDILSDADYFVGSNEELQLNTGTAQDVHRQIWNHIKAISPDDLTANYIDTYRVFTDANDGTLAYIVDEDDDGKFVIAINLATHQKSTPQEQTLTIVHELAHIATLNKDQIAEGTCEYETQEGCFGDQSVLAQFVERFWTQADQDAAANEEDLYSANPSNFVTDYAATNPEEDVAESFAYYVVKNNYDQATVAGQKQAFFDEFDEARDIKADMREAVLRQFVRARAS